MPNLDHSVADSSSSQRAHDTREIHEVVGEYRPTRVLGRGGCAVVYEAEHPRHGTVAVKIADVRLATEEGGQRLLREAALEVRVAHPNVVRVIEVGTTKDGRPFVVMERLRGIDLDSVLEAHGRLPIGAACAITIQALDALDAVHARGIVHRDFKPTNLMLTFPESGDPVVKLIDFGAAHDRRDTRLTDVGMVVGTPLYFAPEQARGEPLDHRVDIWAVGIVLHELLTGRAPVERDSLDETIAAILYGDIPTVRERRPEVPKAISEVVARALSRNRDHRFPTALSMRAALEAAVRRHDVDSSPRTLTRIRVPSAWPAGAANVASLASEANELPHEFPDHVRENVSASLPRASEPPPSLTGTRTPSRRTAAEIVGIALLALLLFARRDSAIIGRSANATAGVMGSGVVLNATRLEVPKRVDPSKHREPVLVGASTHVLQAPHARHAPGAALQVSVDRETVRGLVAHANLATAVGLDPLAHQLFTRAIELNPRYAAGWYGLARTAGRLGDAEGSRTAMLRYRALASPRVRWVRYFRSR